MSKDEVNITAGKLYKRIGQVVLDGSEDWTSFLVSNDNSFYRISIANWGTPNNYALSSHYILENKIHVFERGSVSVNEGMPFRTSIDQSGLFITISKNYLDENFTGTLIGFKEYLNKYPVTLTYQLAEPEIIPIETHGVLKSFGKGTTVYVEIAEDSTLPTILYKVPINMKAQLDDTTMCSLDNKERVQELEKTAHNHTNKQVLDGLAKNEDGFLTFEDQEISGDVRVANLPEQVIDDNIIFIGDTRPLEEKLERDYATKEYAKDYTDSQVALITETGIPKLTRLEYILRNVQVGTTQVQIPSGNFDGRTDTVDLYINTTHKNSDDYTYTEAGLITLAKPLEAVSTLTIHVLKNVPMGEDGSVSGKVIAVDSMPSDRVQGASNWQKHKLTDENGYPRATVNGDCDKVTLAGLYNVTGVVSNVPYSGAAGILEVIRRDEIRLFQRFTGSRGTFNRSSSDNGFTWTDWTSQSNIYRTLITEPYNQLTKTTVNCGFTPKLLILDSVIMGSKYESRAYVDVSIVNSGTVTYTEVGSGNKNTTGGYGVYFLHDSISNRLHARVIFIEAGFELEWTLEGSLANASGNRRVSVVAFA